MKGLWLLMRGVYLMLRGRLALFLLKKYNPPMPEILKWPHPALKVKARDLEPQDFTQNREVIDLIKQMEMALRGARGGNRLGLAANQIGSDLNVCVVLGRVCINLKVTYPKAGTPPRFVTEGCYSSDGNYKVERPPYVWLSWLDINGKEHTEKSNGLFGWVACHEYEHLSGHSIEEHGTKAQE